MNFSYFSVHTKAIQSLREKVRYGQDADNPVTIDIWLMAEQALVANDHKLYRQMYQGQFYLLLDVVSDDLLPKHWRHVCLDNIYRPLTALSRISHNDESKDKLRQLWLELNTISHYFLG